MKRIVPCVVWALLGIAIMPQALAEDEKFVVRAGVFSVNPTSDSVIMTQRNELRSAFGVQGSFEWYFADRVGVEGAAGWAFDADVEMDGDVFAGVSILPLTVGINFHPVRTSRVDWGIGAVAGVVFYSDFTFVDTGMGSVSSVDSDADVGLGAQTFLDIGFGKSARWGASFGVKWLDTDLDFGGQPLSVDPLIVSAGAHFRF